MSSFNSKLSFAVSAFKTVIDISLTASFTLTKDRVVEEFVDQTGDTLLESLQESSAEAPETPEEPAEPSLATAQSLRPQRTPEMLNDISQRIREAQKEITETPQPSIDITPEEEVLVSEVDCAVCGDASIITSNCKKCNALVCPGCLVESIEDGGSYCEECWDQI